MATLLQPSPHSKLIDEILALKEKRNAVILAHNYQIPEIQDIADFVGDSLGLSRQAAKTSAETIVFCGVHFMAETASIVCPDKKVLIPDPEAGCSLADTINAEQLREWKHKYPDAIVVSYVNTTAEVKAESDYCCTSTNAVNVVNSIPKDKEILFLPDIFLGAYVQSKTKRKMHLWPGECHVHAKLDPQTVLGLIDKYPDAEFLIHPECGCVTNCMYLVEEGKIPQKGTYILSTEGMVRHAKQSPANEFVVATETGILHRLKKENPQKNFIPASENAVCQYMKMITVEKLHRSLTDLVYEVKVPKEIADRARVPIERMLAIS
ncbi:MAG: quinolinate synthase NadA [Thaumarchaeota archaeon]|nr:quinolinate synthase NadA [Nitrososphaerota archaeon]